MSAGTTERPAAPAPAPGRPRRPEPAQGAPAVVGTAITMIAVVTLWCCAQVLLLSGVAHDRAQGLLYDRFRTELAELTAPLGPVVPVGDPVAILRLPSLDLEEVVVEGTSSGDLLAGPGHVRDTVLPGQEGTSLVYGRARTYGAPFRDLADLAVGDPVQVVTAQGELDLEVTAVRGEGDPVVPRAADVGRVTLVSVTGEGRLGFLAADTTIYVDAETSEPTPVNGPLPAAVPASEEAMASDTGALPLLALCLAALLALAVGVVHARQRHSAVLVWVIASPLVAAVAWFTTDTAVRLLPNLT